MLMGLIDTTAALTAIVVFSKWVRKQLVELTHTERYRRRPRRLLMCQSFPGFLALFLLAACNDSPPRSFDNGGLSLPYEFSASASRLVSLEETYDTQPDITIDSEGVPWVAWVGYMSRNGEKGDKIYVARRDTSGWTTAEILTPTAGNYLRPVIVQFSEEMVVLWTTTGEETSIWMSRLAAGTWSLPARVTPSGHQFNPEVCVDGQGRLWMVWQAHKVSGYDIFLASFDGVEWSAPIPVSKHPANDWDPSISCDSNGRLWIVWSRFQDADYDLYLVSYEEGQLSEERRLTDHKAYDMHPGLTIDGQDRVWIAWDRMTIPQHGTSGQVVERDGRLVNIGVGSGKPRWDKGKWRNSKSEVDVGVMCLQDGELFTPESGIPFIEPGYQFRHCAYPKIETDASGTVWLAFRAWLFKTPNPHTYWWDVILLSYSGNGWSKPEIVPGTDGNLEEPSIAIGAGSIWVAAQMEYRVSAPPSHPHPENGSLTFEFDHHWASIPQGSTGDIYASQYEVTMGSGEMTLEPAAPFSDEPSPIAKHWISRKSTEYEVDYEGTTYRLLFGDTHKHSNISRCTAGIEPSIDDHYRYSQDVCQHDFFVLSDHSNHTSDFNWWTIQKTADLYYVPGYFVTLFGYELSNVYPTGHKNIIFPKRPAPLLLIGLDKVSTGPGIWQQLKGIQAMAIPHTPALPPGTDWSEHDPEFERVVEIFQSSRGSSEYDGAPRVPGGRKVKQGFVHEALAKGLKLGFIASTDHGFGASYAVVYARSASREDVFEALYARRCYASTARGIVLDFRANGHLMGEEIKSDSGAKLSITVRAHAPIERVDLFADQVIVKKWESNELDSEKHCTLSWTDSNPVPGIRTYYVRVMLQDKEMAWSSPIWVDYSDLSDPTISSVTFTY